MSGLVLGIDPGLTRCGFGLVQQHQDRTLEYRESGVIRSDKLDELQTRLHMVGMSVSELIDQHQPSAIALEQVFSQQNLHSVMSIAQISGVVYFLAQQRDIPVFTYTPTQVKAAVSGYGRAEKQQVKTMVTKLLKLRNFSGPADESDALALAICHHFHDPSSAVSSVTPASRAGKSPVTGELTPAQIKWQAAERRSRGSGA